MKDFLNGRNGRLEKKTDGLELSCKNVNGVVQQHTQSCARCTEVVENNSPPSLNLLFSRHQVKTYHHGYPN